MDAETAIIVVGVVFALTVTRMIAIVIAALVQLVAVAAQGLICVILVVLALQAAGQEEAGASVQTLVNVAPRV